MSYRLYTQPLTMKTESKPIDGELIVDVEDGHILVYDEASDSINSATKNLYGEMSLNEYLVQLVIEQSNAVFIRLNALLEKYPGLEDVINILITSINETKQSLISLKSGFNIQLGNAKSNSTLLLQLYEDLGNLLQGLFDEDYTILELDRISNEYTYLISRVTGVKAQLRADTDVTKAYRNEVVQLLGTRVDKTTYNTWVNNYVTKMKAIHAKINFRHISG